MFDVRSDQEVGGCGVVTVNENRKILLGQCLQNKIRKCKTFFEKSLIRRQTWIPRIRGEDNDSRMQEYYCIRSVFKARLLDVKVLRAAEVIQSNYYLATRNLIYSKLKM